MPTPNSHARVDISQEHGWTKQKVRGVTTWLKGQPRVEGRWLRSNEAAAHLAGVLADLSPEVVGEQLKRIDGHFAFVCKWESGRVLATVDRMRTIPIAYGRGSEGWILDDQALRLQRTLGDEEPDPEASLAVAMAGYTLGRDTLYKQIKQLQSGELAIFEAGRDPVLHRYYIYRAWEVAEGLTRDNWVDQLEAVTRSLFLKLAEGLDGRRVLLPLSGGLDSRLVASGLKQVGYDNVQCYAYGQPGNFEAAASREIAARLKYPWIFVPYTRSAVRACAVTADQKRYLDYADTLCAVPFLQDFLAVRELRNAGLIPDEAIFINGNTGDFISGGHIQPKMQAQREDLNSERLQALVLEELISKHFTLWQDLMTNANRETIERNLSAQIRSINSGEPGPENIHGVYESIECESRQAKYVIGGQRVYEYFGYGWRLPMWDSLYLDFWGRVPLKYKVNQNLYCDFLKRADWGGVWKNYNLKRWVSPRWIRPVRALSKLACAPLGRDSWRVVERRLFSYFTDILWTHATVPVPYLRFAFSNRGYRHSMAFRCEAYLLGKGRDVDGSAH